MATIIKPIRPGTRIRFIGERIPAIAPSLADIVAVPVVTDWGPLGGDADGQVLVSSVLEYDAAFSSTDNAGRRAVLSALAGQGTEDGGAGSVLVYRMAGSAKAKATTTIANSAAATALTVTALFHGTFGNRLRIVNVDDPNGSSRNVLQVYLDVVAGSPLESFTYLDTDIADLVTQINATSGYIRATLGATGTAIPTSGVTTYSPTGGNDGTTLLGSDYVAAVDGLTYSRFSVLAFPNLTDGPTQQLVLNWVRSMEAANRPVTLVVGGDASDTLTSAITRSASFNDPHIVNLGVGQYQDDLFGGATLSTAELAPRIAGVIVARGSRKSLTFAKIAGIRPLAGTMLSNSAIESALQNGVTVFSRATAPDADLKIEKGLTTFTTNTDPTRPRGLFEDPRLVRIMDLYIRTMKEWGDENIIGETTVTDQTRQAVRGKAIEEAKSLETDGLIIPGTSFVETPVSGDPEFDDAIPFDFGWQFAKTTLYLFGNGRVK